MRTFNNVHLVVTDSNGHRNQLTIRDEQLNPGELISRLANFIGDISDISQWAGHSPAVGNSEDPKVTPEQSLEGQGTSELGQTLEDAIDSEGPSPRTPEES